MGLKQKLTSLVSKITIIVGQASHKLLFSLPASVYNKLKLRNWFSAWSKSLVTARQCRHKAKKSRESRLPDNSTLERVPPSADRWADILDPRRCTWTARRGRRRRPRTGRRQRRPENNVTVEEWRSFCLISWDVMRRQMKNNDWLFNNVWLTTKN